MADLFDSPIGTDGFEFTAPKPETIELPLNTESSGQPAFFREAHELLVDRYSAQSIDDVDFRPIKGSDEAANSAGL